MKRPRRQAALGKNYADNEKDPYIYTSGVVLRGSTRRRKLDDDVERLESISPTYSAHRSISAAKPFELATGMFNIGNDLTRLNYEFRM